MKRPDSLQQNNSLPVGASVYRLSFIWHLEPGQRALDTEALGVGLKQGEQAAAAVETVNEGRVWLNRGLGKADTLVIAYAAALLLRSSLADHNDSD